MPTLPTHLYHGSAYLHHELMPGYARSGKLVKWDETESNEWLYATTNMRSAQLLGLASAVEKHYLLNHFKIHDEGITFVVEGNALTYANLKGLGVFLYTLVPRQQDGWVKNNNEHNNLDTEWKTKATIRDGIKSAQRLDLGKWLDEIHVEIEYVDKNGRSKGPAFLNW